MSEDNLQRCPKCGKGRMRRTGRAATQEEKQEPFRDRSYARNYICDNCGHTCLMVRTLDMWRLAIVLVLLSTRLIKASHELTV
jgi:predicted RNA-binding Zn-ribbon protein involved in translation (DUF1610 family)